MSEFDKRFQSEVIVCHYCQQECDGHVPDLELTRDHVVP